LLAASLDPCQKFISRPKLLSTVCCVVTYSPGGRDRLFRYVLCHQLDTYGQF